MLIEFKNKPINHGYALIKIGGEPTINSQLKFERWQHAKDVTNIECTIYHIATGRLLIKPVLFDRMTMRVYVATRQCERLYLDEFKKVNKNE